MKQSKLFTKTLREAPRDEESNNAKLLIRGGFIAKRMAGVYEFLPLGLRVLNNINNIIRKEMNDTGAEELSLSELQPKDLWMKTGRWESARDVMYQFESAEGKGKDSGLSWTNEETITDTARHFISSYADLPKAVYQIQTKFRKEQRPRGGLIRCREFPMKDLYSFHENEADLKRYYQKVAEAYEKIFQCIGLNARRTLASGGAFSEFSEEYQVLCDAGEDTIYFCADCPFTANKEVFDRPSVQEKHSNCSGNLRQGRGIEVANIFELGTRFSDAFGLLYTNEQGEKKPVVMGCYGIGPGRLMGTIVEVHHDERGVIWPRNIAPFDAHLLLLDAKDTQKHHKIRESAERLYADLTKAGIGVLFDDREGVSAGEKFADCDLIGIPVRLVVSEKTVEKKSVEVKARAAKDTKLVKPEEVIKTLK